jgi:hypothetical protein
MDTIHEYKETTNFDRFGEFQSIRLNYRNVSDIKQFYFSFI